MAFNIQRGINISGWLSQSTLRGEERRTIFTQPDARRLADLDFDHLRLPIDEEQLWSCDGDRDPEAWELLLSALEWSAEAGLKVVLVLHTLRSHDAHAAEKPLFTDPQAPIRFADLWADISAELCEIPLDQLAYELLGEPTADDPQDWNRVYPFAYQAIRDTEPNRTIVLGSNAGDLACAFDVLELPENDRNLILSLRYYSPMLLTRYRAGFVKACAAYDGPIQYPGRPIPQATFDALPQEVREVVKKWNTPFGPETMAADMAKPLAMREATGLPLYCGAFGISHNAPQGINRAWHLDLIGLLEREDIAWANWAWKGSFGAFDADGNAPPWWDHVLTL